MIAEQFDILLLDLDGVVYVGDRLLPGARRALRRLRERGTTLRFLTNDPRPTRNDVVDRLDGLGVEAAAHEVVTCGWTTAVYLRENEVESAYVVGSDGLRRELDRAGVRPTNGDEAEAVVVGCDEEIAYPHLKRAARLIHDGAHFVATNEDPTFPTPEGPAPATGTIVAAVRAASGKTPHVVGKPHPAMFEAALNDRDPSAAVMVGDRLDTDIRGARRMGMSALFLRREDERPQHHGTDVTPDRVIASLSDLLNESVRHDE
ncbi:HAD-IIA family hydrolase [Salinibacter sp.]|mgnify:CR=1 FL=1|jgi:HAD superfamily hydrolase (TIGR01450 family)|uniref:HAD-IIA family hydrolase n=1 Tax=Salinibacter sp. TaxID=2065818 RepID=UPI0021E6EA3D|nr:HAD-IIA family hydrolase [Salinibacter sp.]